MLRLSSHPFLFAGVFAAAAYLSGCASHANNDPRIEAPLVQVATVRPANGMNRAFTGVVTARVQSDLGFRVPGKITERLVDTGEIVHTGQLLMRIDRTDYAHAITAQIGTVAAARARADQTAADEARYRGLVATGAASASTYDQMTAAATLQQAAELIDYDAFRRQQQQWRADGRLVGVGTCLFAEPSAMSRKRW